jgi:hypothetical protein
LKNKSRSQIIIIGPFPDQVLDLSSSSSSSASESEDDSESEDGMLSPPTTPTRPGGNDVPLVDSPPSPTDWVEYSAPQAEDEELGHDLSFTSGTSSLPSTHALPCYGLFEPAILVPQEAQRVSSPGRDTAFVQKLVGLEHLKLADATAPAVGDP